MLNLLIIDDNISFLDDAGRLLKDNYKVFKADDGRKGIDILRNENISILLLSLNLPDPDGLEILKKVHEEIDPDMPVIVLSGDTGVDSVVKAMSLGAADYIKKDIKPALLHQKIISSIDKRRMSLELKMLKDSQDSKNEYFVCTSSGMRKVYYEISKIAFSNADVLLIGETGTGKDIVAYEIHKRSKRKDKPFVEISLNSLSDTLIESELFGYEKGAFSGADTAKTGKFEAANGGTIYLPEISDISERIQAKLLSFMQYKEISKVGPGSVKRIKLDVRLIMASNKDLCSLVRAGKLREDFYYRINVTKIYVPPLRDRSDGVEDLSGYFLSTSMRRYNKSCITFSPGLIAAMKKYDWRGNVRELKNCIESAVVMAENGEVLTVNDFPNLIAPTLQETEKEETFQSAMLKAKHEYFSRLLAEFEGNKSRAAVKAGLSRQGLQKILKELGME